MNWGAVSYVLHNLHQRAAHENEAALHGTSHQRSRGSTRVASLGWSALVAPTGAVSPAPCTAGVPPHWEGVAPYAGLGAHSGCAVKPSCAVYCRPTAAAPCRRCDASPMRSSLSPVARQSSPLLPVRRREGACSGGLRGPPSMRAGLAPCLCGWWWFARLGCCCCCCCRYLLDWLVAAVAATVWWCMLLSGQEWAGG
jgi:hypothetical protein